MIGEIEKNVVNLEEIKYLTEDDYNYYKTTL